MTPSRPPIRRTTQSFKSSNARSASGKNIPAAVVRIKPSNTKAPPASKTKRRLRTLLIFLMLTSPFVIGAAFKQQLFQSAASGPGFVVLERVISSLGNDMKAQITLAIETPDKASAEVVKLYAPKLRSMLFLTTAEFESKELLTQKGKEKLADTLTEVFKKNVDEERSELILGVHYMEFVIAQ